MLAFMVVLLLFLINPSSGNEEVARRSRYNIVGYRIEPTSNNQMGKLEYEPENGAFRIPRGHEFRLRIYGTNMSSFLSVAFTKRLPAASNNTGDVVYCDDLGHTLPFRLTPEYDGDHGDSAVADLYFSTEWMTSDVVYYFCLEQNGTDEFVYQGNKLAITVYHMQPYILPLPFEVTLMGLCLTLSWVFSGLNLGLMSLDCTELQLIMRCGSEEDRRFAKAIEPIRRRGNTLLCTILLANTIVNSSYTLLLDDIIGEGIYALIGSTLGIVIFGEILPQAVCSRYGLKVGYYARWIIMFFMYLLYPLTFTCGKLLDCIFGHEIHQVYSRDKLREIVMMTGEDILHSISKANADGENQHEHLLKQEEIKILTGALQMNETTVRDIMKLRNDVFMLDIKQNITYDLIDLVVKNGYTRIPVYANGNRDNVVGLLYSSDLLGIDPEGRMPLNSLVEYYDRQVVRVEEDRTILSMLNTFKEAKVHLAIVDRVEVQESRRTIAGIVTLEDIIEFILREKIVDEKPMPKDEHEGYMENAAVAKVGERSEIIPQQLCTAATQFLIANVELFRKEIVERKVLARLLRFPGVFITKKYNPEIPAENVLYSFNRPTDYFTMTLQGTCHVRIGREDMSFEAGPFHFFGLEALSGTSEQSDEKHSTTTPAGSLSSISPHYTKELSVFRPDFSVEIASDVQYLRLTHAMYRALTSVTRLARTMKKCDDPLFLVEKLSLEMKPPSHGLILQQPIQQPKPTITVTSPMSPRRLAGHVSCYPTLPQYGEQSENNAAILQQLFFPPSASEISTNKRTSAEPQSRRGIKI